MTALNHITADEKAAFARDGAALLKGKFDVKWLTQLRDGIDTNMANPTANFSRHTKDPDAPGY